jgi:aldehyde dehydrogenase (NAD+)
MAGQKLAPALACGCTMIVKPAEQTPLSMLRLAELMAEAGLPAGVVNVLNGMGETTGQALVDHLDVDKVCFTGSTDVGRQIIRSSVGNLKRVSLELGGKSPDIVFADANLDVAVPGAGMGVFANTGQVCCAGTRIFVERGIYDEFVSRLAAFAKQLRVGNSVDPATEIGPLVSHAHLEKVSSYLTLGAAEGATTVTGGSRITDGDLANGYFVEPTIFADVDGQSRVASEEIFGPIGVVLPFDELDEVAEQANRTMYGLGSGIWTRSLSNAHQLSARLRAGVVWINTYGNFDPAIPFGGVKSSGCKPRRPSGASCGGRVHLIRCGNV